MIYLKKFETHQEYETYINDRQNLVLPNVSFCEDTPNEVHYNPYVPFFCKLTLNDGSVVDIEGSGELTSAMTTEYRATCVSAEIGELCTSIGEGVFNDCTSLSSVTIGSGVTSIGKYAFRRCNGLTNIEIPNSVTSIAPYAFFTCIGLSSITIPNSVTSIADSTFSECESLISITVDGGNIKYDSRDNCNAIIETATNKLIRGCQNTVIPNSITSIGNYAFDGCYGLSSITIPNSVTSIGNTAFGGCTGLTSIDIPSGVTIIGTSAFAACASLSSVTIGSGVTSIYNTAFGGCTGLTKITSYIMTAPSVLPGTFNVGSYNGTLYVPIGSSGYETWMNNQGNLGMFNWTKVEQ